MISAIVNGLKKGLHVVLLLFFLIGLFTTLLTWGLVSIANSVNIASWIFVSIFVAIQFLIYTLTRVIIRL